MSPLKGNPNTHLSTLTGTCLCGSIQIRITDSSLWKSRGHLCHCANCRKGSGSHVGSTSNLNIEEDKVSIRDTRKSMKMYSDLDIMSGNQVERFFCSECGCPVKSMTALLPGRVILKMDMFPPIPPPGSETFALRRHPWQGRHEGVVQWQIKAGEEPL